MLTVPGNTSKVEKGQSYIVEQAAHHNLPHGLVMNSCCVTAKARKVPVILINDTDQNIWVRQTLLATELFEVEAEPSNTTQNLTVKGMKVLSHSCQYLHMRDKNRWRIMQWRWKKTLIHQRKKISQRNTQNLGKGLTLVRPMILKKKLRSYHLSSIWGMLLLQKNNRIDC